MFFGPSVDADKKMHEILRKLQCVFQLKKLTTCFLDNMFCKIKRLACHNGEEGWESRYWNKEYLLSPDFQRYVAATTVTKKPDLYFEDVSLGQYQHLFLIMDNKLYLRDAMCIV